MKTVFCLALGALAAVSLSSCGNCNCNSYNPELLRDVPVTRSQSFH